MRQLEEYQLRRIEDALRLVANAYDMQKRESCMARDVMESCNWVYNALQDKPDGNSLKYRMRVGQTPYNDENYPDKLKQGGLTYESKGI